MTLVPKNKIPFYGYFYNSTKVATTKSFNYFTLSKLNQERVTTHRRKLVIPFRWALQTQSCTRFFLHLSYCYDLKIFCTISHLQNPLWKLPITRDAPLIFVIKKQLLRILNFVFATFLRNSLALINFNFFLKLIFLFIYKEQESSCSLYILMMRFWCCYRVATLFAK